jgi:hypothetical protein
MSDTQIDWYSILSGFGSKSMDEIGLFPFLGVMSISLLSSFFIALLYIRFYKPRSTGSRIYRAFPLLGISITAIFIAIQFSLPLSLGLLGALSIVRFRTPIKEPEEIGFIMLVVATSLCCATFNILFLVVIHCVAIVALVALHFGQRFLVVSKSDGVIILEVPKEVYNKHDSDILNIFNNTIKKGRLNSVSENDSKTVISFDFPDENETTLQSLKKSFNAVHSEISTSIFYNNNQAI